MAQLSKSAFLSKWLTLFATNGNREIDAARARDFRQDISDSFLNGLDDVYKGYLATAAGTDTYTATASPAITAYASGQRFYVLFTNANNGSATLNLNELGAVSIVKNGGSALVEGDIEAGQVLELVYDGSEFQIIGGSNNATASQEINRTYTTELLFDKKEITMSAQSITENTTFELAASGHLVDQFSSMRMRLLMDGVSSLSFGSGFDFIYGITNGQVLEAGTYEVYLLYLNGSVTVNIPGVSAQTSQLVQLSAPGSFSAVSTADDSIDLSWTDVSNESSYLIEFSLTGTGSWATVATPAANSTSATHTGLSAGVTYYYRLTAVGDGVNYSDSPYATASATTSSSGDVTAPTFTFLPANAATGWPVNKPLTITANEAIRNTDGTEITNANVASRITLKETNSSGANIAFTATISTDKTIITVTPDVMYGLSQVVYVAISNVEDNSGNEVTVAQSITFTTSDYSYFNGTSNRVIFGDVLDSLFTANDTNFWLETTIQNHSMSGQRILVGKHSESNNQRSMVFQYIGTDVYFAFFSALDNTRIRSIKWTNVLTSGEHTLVLKYDGSIDTNDGLDRCTLEIDGIVQGSKTLDLSHGTMGEIVNSTAQLAVGVFVTSAGTPDKAAFFSGEMKDFIIRSSAGSVVELNVPNLSTGTDTSGNALNGTWV